MFNKLSRPFVTNLHITGSLEDLDEELKRAIDKHGQGAFVTTCEISGVLKEEVDEFLTAVHDNDFVKVYKELSHIAQVAVFGMASIRQGAQDYIESNGKNLDSFFKDKIIME
jgi:antirestriction protein ArdC